MRLAQISGTNVHSGGLAEQVQYLLAVRHALKAWRFCTTGGFGQGKEGKG